MAVYQMLLKIVVGLSLFRSGRCLVCYDNLVDEIDRLTALIDCSYNGAACAVTNRTITKYYHGFRNGRIVQLNSTYNETNLLYHCAHKSCQEAPFSYCTVKTGQKDVHCSHQCCTSEKCNMPAEGNITIKKVDTKDALGCYQYIGRKVEKVKCLFEGARCLSGIFRDIIKVNDTVTMFCAVDAECRAWESSCHSYRKTMFDVEIRTCSLTCCDSDYCNDRPTVFSSGNTIFGGGYYQRNSGFRNSNHGHQQRDYYIGNTNRGHNERGKDTGKNGNEDPEDASDFENTGNEYIERGQNVGNTTNGHHGQDKDIGNTVNGYHKRNNNIGSTDRGYRKSGDDGGNTDDWYYKRGKDANNAGNKRQNNEGKHGISAAGWIGIAAAALLLLLIFTLYVRKRNRRSRLRNRRIENMIQPVPVLSNYSKATHWRGSTRV